MTSISGPASTSRPRRSAASMSIVGAGMLLHAGPLGRAPARGGIDVLRQEFPHLPWQVSKVLPPGAALIDERAWREPSNPLYDSDMAVLSLERQSGWIFLQPDRSLEQGAETLVQILTRYQRLAPRLNAFSRERGFREALRLHRDLHDLSKPLVVADYDHALDVWQWVLRLVPNAGRALQLAALFHDIERLSSEPDVRIEQHACDYQAFKDAHAKEGARLAVNTARAAGIPLGDCALLERLVEHHERPSRAGRDAQTETLGDADALSFFSLNSPGFADYYGHEHTRKKVRYTLERMSRRALERISALKLRADIEGHIVDAGYGAVVTRLFEVCA